MQPQIRPAVMIMATIVGIPHFAPDPDTCAQNCVVEGANLSTARISASGYSVTFERAGPAGGGPGHVASESRIFLLANETNYQMFNLLNQELAFDVSLHYLECEVNAALRFVQMDPDGGLSKWPKGAGAKYGAGYCDSKCPHRPFLNGQANLVSDAGACCNEMNVWAANTISTVLTAHPCSVSGFHECVGSECQSGVCDPDGCDFNPYRLGDPRFYGRDSTIPNDDFTVVTQFITNDSTSTGTLTEIRRSYLQNGQVIQNSKVQLPDVDPYDSITESFCAAKASAFGEPTTFQDMGGLAALSKAMAGGMVLTMSFNDGPVQDMLWLDGNYPPQANATKPGVVRGPCQPFAAPIGLPVTATGTFSNIRFGDIGSTLPRPTPTRPPSSGQTNYGQCGGEGWPGPFECEPPFTCVAISPPWFSQCLP
ncbi:glycoside hydrolase [Pluteus cervinus]|uniref:Glycoside hydrolase n=1 Tax=Pluteus cervinus TaxID=181527 RepID=A0ACD3AGW0_9AGAR|nr:glycoside hydrolase [Pluteus cervinus]